MTSGQIQWNKTNDQRGVTTTLTVSCLADGSIHMETPPSQGGFSENYQSPQEASQGLVAAFEQGSQQASQN